jgi:hypothetical protein
VVLLQDIGEGFEGIWAAFGVGSIKLFKIWKKRKTIFKYTRSLASSFDNEKDFSIHDTQGLIVLELFNEWYQRYLIVNEAYFKLFKTRKMNKAARKESN